MTSDLLQQAVSDARSVKEQAAFHVGVIGSRSWKNEELLEAFMDKLRARYGRFTLVSGGAQGADTMAAKYVREYEHEVIVYRPDYPKHGNKATFIRNRQIVDDCETLISFWDNCSAGSKFTMDFAVESHIPVFVVEPTGKHYRYFGKYTEGS